MISIVRTITCMVAMRLKEIHLVTLMDELRGKMKEKGSGLRADM